MSIKVMRQLYSYCESGKQDDLEGLLRDEPDEIDFESEDYGGDALFLAAMSSPKAEQIIRALVDFYQQYKIDTSEPGSHERMLARQKLGTMLQEAYDLSSLESEGIHDIVTRYTASEEEVCSTDSDVGGASIELDDDWKANELEHGTSGLTLENLIALNKSNLEKVQPSTPIERWYIADLAFAGDVIVGATDIVWDE